MSVGPWYRVKHSVARNPGSISAAWRPWTMDMAPNRSPLLVFCFVPFENFCENLIFSNENMTQIWEKVTTNISIVSLQ